LNEAKKNPPSASTALRPHLTYPLSFRTIPEALEAAPASEPFVTMWKCEEEVQTVTFGEFRALVSGQAGFLRRHGVIPGDTVILVMPQGITLMAVFAAAMHLGAIPTILAYPNCKVDPSKYRYGLSGVSANLKARLIVVDDAFPEQLRAHLSVGDRCNLTETRADLQPPQTPITSAHLNPDRIAFIQHSSGTTGLQKGVALSHAAVLRQISHLATALHVTSEDRIYSWLPLYHDMGLIACFILPLICHLPVVMQSPTDWVVQPGTMMHMISKYRCTLAWIPNFTLQFLARRVRPEDRSQYDLSSLRMLINCSEPVRAASMDEFLIAYRPCHLHPHVLQSSYAMAETIFAATQSGWNGHPDPGRLWVDAGVLRKKHLARPVAPDAPGAICLVSSGACLPGTQIHIVSETGDHLPSGNVGEIVIHSNAMLDGYYNRPDLTANALREGSYWSGDLGFELDGELYVIGRKKDLIIVGGENIYPQDIEEIISRHPSIHDGRTIAIGVYNSNLGTQEIIAVAEVNDDKDLKCAIQIERDLKMSIKVELAIAVRAIYLKPPKWIVKSTAGKPARSTTHEKLLSEHPELSVDTQGEFDS
jgi:acyl-CoA synthetase (AMP-forming)/AMP-acid ligase II